VSIAYVANQVSKLREGLSQLDLGVIVILREIGVHRLQVIDGEIVSVQASGLNMVFLPQFIHLKTTGSIVEGEGLQLLPKTCETRLNIVMRGRLIGEGG
jgi:hypothetical protein